MGGVKRYLPTCWPACRRCARVVHLCKQRDAAAAGRSAARRAQVLSTAAGKSPDRQDVCGRGETSGVERRRRESRLFTSTRGEEMMEEQTSRYVCVASCVCVAKIRGRCLGRRHPSFAVSFSNDIYSFNGGFRHAGSCSHAPIAFRACSHRTTPSLFVGSRHSPSRVSSDALAPIHSIHCACTKEPSTPLSARR